MHCQPTQLSEGIVEMNSPQASQVLTSLKGMADAGNVKGMARFGINSKNTLGVPVPAVRALASEIGRSHQLALELWRSGIHEARLLAGFIDEPAAVTPSQMESGRSTSILGTSAIRTANEILRIDSKVAKWIASDALRELQGPAVVRKLAKQ